MSDRDPTEIAWAHFRFSVVGPLLASPPEPGQLQQALSRLAQTPWRHPITAMPVHFARSTIERWYYAALASNDPVRALQRKTRSDRGQARAVAPRLAALIHQQYQEHPSWSYQLHYDNLAVVVDDDPELARLPAYGTVRRFMRSHGWIKQRRTVGEKPSVQAREKRSFEVEHCNALWHLDFHHGSRKILTSEGTWATPILLAILDDHSRLCCHLQWYLHETTECLVHGLMQAFIKRGLCRALLSDNGGAMIADETRQGLLRLSVLQRTTMPNSPYQNGKQEVFFAQVESRLLAMLEGQADIDLRLLNEATLAWVEMEYHRTVHSETGQTPLERFLQSPCVSRECPALDELRFAFTTQRTRTLRKSDGTISLDGTRYEVPARFAHLGRLTLRYHSWDKRFVFLVDDRSGVALERIYPIDKARNASGVRRPVTPQHSGEPTTQATGIAPLLRKLMADYAATGLPPAYIAKETS